MKKNVEKIPQMVQNVIHKTSIMHFVAILRHPSHIRELEDGLFWIRAEKKPIWKMRVKINGWHRNPHCSTCIWTWVNRAGGVQMLCKCCSRKKAPTSRVENAKGGRGQTIYRALSDTTSANWFPGLRRAERGGTKNYINIWQPSYSLYRGKGPLPPSLK